MWLPESRGALSILWYSVVFNKHLAEAFWPFLWTKNPLSVWWLNNISLPGQTGHIPRISKIWKWSCEFRECVGKCCHFRFDLTRPKSSDTCLVPATTVRVLSLKSWIGILFMDILYTGRGTKGKSDCYFSGWEEDQVNGLSNHLAHWSLSNLSPVSSLSPFPPGNHGDGEPLWSGLI